MKQEEEIKIWTSGGFTANFQMGSGICEKYQVTCNNELYSKGFAVVLYMGAGYWITQKM
jgi:hypothetical protein